MLIHENDIYGVDPESDCDVVHYGTPRHSGRYPWGSGENPYQHESWFIGRVEELKKQGITSDVDLAKALGMKSSTEFRNQYSIEKNNMKRWRYETAKAMRHQGKTFQEIANELGMANESSVRTLLNMDDKSKQKMDEAKTTADRLRQLIEEKKTPIDISPGVELELGVSHERLMQAAQILQNEGYTKHAVGIDQVTNAGKRQNLTLLCPKDETWHQAYLDAEAGKVSEVVDYIHTVDNGKTWNDVKPPVSISSDRVKIRYAEDGGDTRDGLIEIRPGVPDLNLGGSHYCQVRIAVDGKNYLKGMAAYSNDIPKGYDIIFNTHKDSSKTKDEVFKSLKDDPNNPFGALIKPGGQSEYLGKDGKMHQSAINKVRDEGDWLEWDKGLPSQFLAKQDIKLIKQQLDISYADRVSELKLIQELNNPVIRKYFLESYAKDCDKAAVELKAASLPRQKYQVILPLNDISDKEIYAPNFRDGEKVALVRFPHGGTYEIPILVVNNKNKEGRERLTNTAKDAVGINANVAARLSGADFDGDTVMVIPTGGKVKINSTPALEGLKGFTVDQYAIPKGNPNKVKLMTNTQNEMGVVSNLIMDMTMRGATPDELARATRHSMVVIDAEKHGLDYQQSEKDNGIAALKKKYQVHVDPYTGETKYGGASTLLTLAKNPDRVVKRQGEPKINIEGKSYYDPNRPEGALIWKESDRARYTTVNKKTGDIVEKVRTEEQPKMMTIGVDDARKLSSGTVKEEVYANYANRLKALANTARKDYATTSGLQYDKNARILYSKEVDSLNAKLNVALKNKPRERQAQIIANSQIIAVKKANPNMGKEEEKKKRQQYLELARAKTGSSSKDRKIEITDREWEAIQSGAITSSKLNSILENTDVDKLRDRATPKNSKEISNAKVSRIKAMSATFTIQEIADALGISTSTVSKYLKG